MNLVDEGLKAIAAIRALGPKRLMALAAVGASVIAIVGVSAYLLSRPQFEVLYSGLDGPDASRIVNAMREANIPFDVSTDGATVMVESGRAAQARMLLAERGLPRGASGGYELFDKLGSLGLTSFMQQTTRVRALEGELARSIQSIQGVRTARVHLVLLDEGGFRRSKRGGSASVIVGMESVDQREVARAIRHLVAAAAPGLSVSSVTVLDTDGAVLASGEDNERGNPAQVASQEKIVSETIRSNISRTLAPLLGAHGFHVSVAAKIDSVKKEIRETIYNPEGKVERSVRVVKENLSSRNSNGQAPTSVERNIPEDKAKPDAKDVREDNQKKEETTNYEVSSKSIETASSGGGIERLSIAVVVDRRSLLGKDGAKADDKTVAARVAELSDLTASAAGARRDRGDTVKVVVSNFVEAAPIAGTGAGPGIAEFALRLVGPAARALGMIAIALIVVVFGLRPIAKSLAAYDGETKPALADLTEETAALSGPAEGSTIALPSHAPEESSARQTKRRLEQIVDADEAIAAAIVKQWVRAETNA